MVEIFFQYINIYLIFYVSSKKMINIEPGISLHPINTGSWGTALLGGSEIMRCIIECRIAAENGNRSILDGTLPEKIKNYLETVKPEAVYFTVRDGQRTMIAVVNIPSEDKMVATNEPLWLDWNASVTITPAMSLADLQKAGSDMERIAKERRS